MKFGVKNIGKISQACIEINGITVIAGENNTGKSTIGKALYSVFNSLYRLDEFVVEEKVKSFANILRKYCRENHIRDEEDDIFGIFSDSRIDKIPYEQFAEELYKKQSFYKSFDIQETVITDYIIEFLKNYDANIQEYINLDDTEKCADEILRRIMITDKRSAGIRIKRNLNEEFENQVVRLGTDDSAEINLFIKNQQLTIIYQKNEVETVEGLFPLKTELVYIDDPFVLDALGGIDLFFEVSEHKRHLKRLLSRSRFNGAVDEIAANDRIKAIYAAIAQVSNGNVAEESSEWMYQEDGKSFTLSNLSTGLKTFVIIKQLLSNGVIENNGAIILDEPEIHLHPKWQLIFAETIVLIQKEFNLHILINTHSPYFLDAIEVYSKKHGINEKCKYYLSCQDSVEGTYTFKDVTECTEEIYSLLAAPFQNLEDDEWQ